MSHSKWNADAVLLFIIQFFTFQLRLIIYMTKDRRLKMRICSCTTHTTDQHQFIRTEITFIIYFRRQKQHKHERRVRVWMFRVIYKWKRTKYVSTLMRKNEQLDDFFTCFSHTIHGLVVRIFSSTRLQSYTFSLLFILHLYVGSDHLSFGLVLLLFFSFCSWIENTFVVKLSNLSANAGWEHITVWCIFPLYVHLFLWSTLTLVH